MGKEALQSNTETMFEQIALSLSTALFFLCTLVVNSVLPETPANTKPIDAGYEISDERTVPTYLNVDSFSIVGDWNNGGRCFSFKNDGKLLFDGQEASWLYDGENMVIKKDIDGNKRIYTLKLEVLEPNVIRLNGVTFYKTK